MDERERDVVLITIDAGGGHRSAARALVAAAAETGAPVRFRVEIVVLCPLICTTEFILVAFFA